MSDINGPATVPASSSAHWWPWAREALLLVTGLFGMIYELVARSVHDPLLVGGFLLMMGFPIAFPGSKRGEA